MAGGRGDRGRICHLELHPRDCGTLWYRPADQAGTSDDSSFVVFKRRALDGGGADERWRERATGVPLPLYVQRLLQLRKRIQPGVSGHETVSRAVRASTGVAQGPRLRGQASGCHRKRSHGGDAGSGACQGCRARDDAAAVSELCGCASAQGRNGQLDVPAFAARAWRKTYKMEERAVQHRHVLSRAHQTRDDEGLDPEGNQAATASRLRRETALYAALQPMGSAYLF